MAVLLLDLDGTVRETKSGEKFINDPDDQKLITGVEEAIAKYDNLSWKIVGVTNQGGVASGFKTLESAIKEQQITLDLIPKMRFILFCPDMSGRECFMVEPKETNYKLTRLGLSGIYEAGQIPMKSPDYTIENSVIHVKQVGSFQKPKPGMLISASNFFSGYLTENLMIGDREDDQLAAKAARMRFMWAEDWCSQK